MPAWNFLPLFADETGLSRADAAFTHERNVIDFASPTLSTYGTRASGAIDVAR